MSLKPLENLLRDIFDVPENKSSTGQSIDAYEVIEQGGLDGISYELVEEHILSKKHILRQLLSHDTETPSSNLIIYPVPDYIITLLPVFQDAFDTILLFDNFKCGSVADGLHIHSSDKIPESFPQDTTCFVPSKTAQLLPIFRRDLPETQTVELLEFCERVNEHNHIQHGISEEVTSFIDRINQDEKALVLFSVSFMSTWQSAFENMMGQGYRIYWIAMHDITDPKGYSTVATQDTPVTEYCFVNMVELLHLLSEIRNRPILINHESLLHPVWNMRKAAYGYAIGAALCQIAQGNLGDPTNNKAILFMYDGVKPVEKELEYGPIASIMYQQMMHSTDAVIFNSTTEEFADLLRNAIGFDKPSLHLYRWSTCPSVEKPRLSEGLHIAVISSMLGEFYEPSRAGVRPYIKQVLEQGVHLHYYGDRNQTDEIDRFADGLDANCRTYFHMHDVILDQQELVNEIQIYHAGWVLHDHHIFSKMVWEIEDKFMRTALEQMSPTTVATSALTYGAAGLPVFINRGMVAAAKLFPGTAVPLTLEEVRNIKKIMSAPEWNTKLQKARDNQHMFSFDSHAYKLIEFFEQLDG